MVEDAVELARTVVEAADNNREITGAVEYALAAALLDMQEHINKLEKKLAQRTMGAGG